MAVAIAADPSFGFRWNPHMSPTLISTIFSIGCADPLPPISSAPSKGFSRRFWNLTAGGGSWRWDRGFSSFIISFPFQTSNAEDDGKRVQDFLTMMETTIKEHPLWAHATYEEIDSAIEDTLTIEQMVANFISSFSLSFLLRTVKAGCTRNEIVEGLEKYIMTKLFTHTFASSSEDAKLDLEISEKICLLQHFIKPDHLDVPRVFQNEASWLFAAKELQKINFFKAPRDKLLCIMNCCRIINNLLLDISMSTNHTPAGADDFLPILIYVTIKASSLSTYFVYITIKVLLVGVYCRDNIHQKSLLCYQWQSLPFLTLSFSSVYSMVALEALSRTSLANPPQLHSNLKFVQLYRKHSKLVSEVEYYLTNLISAKTFITNINASSLSMDESEFHRNMQLARLSSEITVNEPSGTVQLSEGSLPIVRNKYIYVEGMFSFCWDDWNQACFSGNRYPFMEAEARDLRLEDVQQLLGLYKQVVTKYQMLSAALRQLSIDENQLLNNQQRQDMKEKMKQQLEQAGNSGGTR
ncbi:VPS9 [Musa troglodytarum]|uniref:VPS9 n=1 Tax=Musa troglodytarum TaxID=320322 RepID=A0A9E7K7D0_9LILI|nr:VPS9 [Musa troglodytarum]